MSKPNAPVASAPVTDRAQAAQEAFVEIEFLGFTAQITPTRSKERSASPTGSLRPRAVDFANLAANPDGDSTGVRDFRLERYRTGTWRTFSRRAAKVPARLAARTSSRSRR